MPFELGDERAICGLISDIDSEVAVQKRAARMYAALSRTNAAVAHEQDRGRLCADVCRITVEQGGLTAALIRRQRPDGDWERLAAHQKQNRKLLISLSPQHAQFLRERLVRARGWNAQKHSYRPGPDWPRPSAARQHFRAAHFDQPLVRAGDRRKLRRSCRSWRQADCENRRARSGSGRTMPSNACPIEPIAPAGSLDAKHGRRSHGGPTCRARHTG